MEQRLSTLANAVQGSYNQVEGAHVSAHGAQVQLHADAEPRAVDLAARHRSMARSFSRGVSSCRSSCHAGNASRGARRLCDARADACPRRDRVPRALLQRHDAAPRARQRRRAPSQHQVERERRKLEVILARLSTGVVSLEPDLRIRTANHAASAILGVDLETHVGESIVALAQKRALCSGSSSEWLKAICKAATGSGASRSCCGPKAGGASHVRLYRAARRHRQPERLRDRVRRHYYASPSAARRRMGGGRSSPCARDQESADADPALRRKAAPQVSEARRRRESCSIERRTPSSSRSRR